MSNRRGITVVELPIFMGFIFGIACLVMGLPSGGKAAIIGFCNCIFGGFALASIVAGVQRVARWNVARSRSHQ